MFISTNIRVRLLVDKQYYKTQIELTLRVFNQYFTIFVLGLKTRQNYRILIIQGYPDGGLKMVNIETYMHGVKAPWVKGLTFSNNVILK